MVKQSGAQPPRPGESEQDRKTREQQDNLKQHEKEELARWQREEAKMAEERESTLERRPQDEIAYRYHLERQKREQEDYGNREKQERERQERERFEREKQEQERQRAERERRERDRQALERIERERAERERAAREREERERAERERVERERAEREREERERAEEERIMNQLQKEELDEQREREDHMKQLEEEEVQFRSMEQARLSKLSSGKGSKEYLDTIESLTADEVEREFKKRLEEERKRKEAGDDSEVNSHYALSFSLPRQSWENICIDRLEHAFQISDKYFRNITEAISVKLPTLSKPCITSSKIFFFFSCETKKAEGVFYVFFNHKRSICVERLKVAVP